MGLLRLGVIAAVGVALLPSDREQQEILYNRAALAAQWAVTFCDRNVQTCSVAGDAWEGFKKKAQFGARLAYDTLAEQLASGEYDHASNAEAYKPPAGGRALETGTLKASDLSIEWRGGQTRQGQKTQSRLDTKSGG